MACRYPEQIGVNANNAEYRHMICNAWTILGLSAAISSEYVNMYNACSENSSVINARPMTADMESINA